MNSLIETEIECVDGKLKEMGIEDDGFFLPATIDLNHVMMMKPSTVDTSTTYIYMISGESWGIKYHYEDLVLLWKLIKQKQ